MSELSLIAAAAGIHLVVVALPGPNFMVISRNALVYSRRAGIFTTAGVATGSLVWVIGGFLGASALIARSTAVFHVIKLAGAAYLIVLGVRGIVASLRHQGSRRPGSRPDAPGVLSDRRAYRMGITTMMTNAKAAVYFVAIFTTVLSPGTPMLAKGVLVILLPSISFAWYSAVATAFGHDHLRSLYRRAERSIGAVFGGLLVAVGVWVGVDRA